MDEIDSEEIRLLKASFKTMNREQLEAKWREWHAPRSPVAKPDSTLELDILTAVRKAQIEDEEFRSRPEEED